MNLLEAIKINNRWYKNCKSVRKRGGKICKECPFRIEIEFYESIVEKGILEKLANKKKKNKGKKIKWINGMKLYSNTGKGIKVKKGTKIYPMEVEKIAEKEIRNFAQIKKEEGIKHWRMFDPTDVYILIQSVFKKFLCLKKS